MLKRILLNNRVVPVPVPILNLAQALAWVESALVPAGSVITRVLLDHEVVPYEDGALPPKVSDRNLGEKSRLEIQMDSPATLAVQTLDTIHSLAAAVLGTLKPIAVHAWQAKPSDRVPEVASIHDDLKLLVDLIGHTGDLLQAASSAKLVDPGPVLGIGHLVEQNLSGYSMARSQSDWKACARLMLNRFEPLLKDLLTESETLQIRVLAIQPQLTIPTASGGYGTMGEVTPIRRTDPYR
jgi:hypothetical protein